MEKATSGQQCKDYYVTSQYLYMLTKGGSIRSSVWKQQGKIQRIPANLLS